MGDRAGTLLLRREPPPDPSTLEIHKILLATEGRRIPHKVMQEVYELARPHNAEVVVIAIARIWGTSFGFPNPGLQPTKPEWDEQRLIVRQAIENLEKAGFEASGAVYSTRRAARRILKVARSFGADVIVMGADEHRKLIGDFMWSQEPHRVARRARVPVVLVDVPLQADTGRKRKTNDKRRRRV
jgi:nucleotide-binding universal stress UspA family protein